jgi:hypothetical protein
MIGGTGGLVTLRHALALAARIPELAGDHVTIVRTIELPRWHGM